MPTKKEELEKLRAYLMGLPEVQAQINLRGELLRHSTFHSRYYGDPPALQKVHVQIKNTFFVLNVEYGVLQGWLKRLNDLKAEHFSGGISFYRVRERGIPHDRSVNAKTLERAAKKK